MRENLASVLDHIGLSEGGLVDHPDDPGGRTNRGITTRTWHAWLRRQGRAICPVDGITREEARTILADQYWHSVRGDDLPAGIDLAAADFAVNSGPATAAQHLQRLVGAHPDGIIGLQTLSLIERHPDREVLITAYCAARLKYMRGLKTWRVFGGGWKKRVEKVERDAIALHRGADAVPAPLPRERLIPDHAAPEKTAPAARANPGDVKLGGVKEAVAAAPVAVSAVAALKGLDGPIGYAVAFFIALAAVAVVVALVRRGRVA
jgi:lysozyme family protein